VFNVIKHNLLIVILVLLTFIGQAIASTAVPCHQMNAMDMSSQQMAMMDHSMASDNQANEGMIKADCCQQDCNCPLGISASATLSTSLTIEYLAFSSQKIAQYSNLLSSQSLTSLYRPPIF